MVLKTGIRGHVKGEIALQHLLMIFILAWLCGIMFLFLTGVGCFFLSSSAYASAVYIYCILFC